MDDSDISFIRNTLTRFLEDHLQSFSINKSISDAELPRSIAASYSQAQVRFICWKTDRSLLHQHQHGTLSK